MLCTVFMVFTADSAEADVIYMYINGHTVTGDDANDEEGWSFIASTRTLTLNNATLDDAVYSDDVTHMDSTIDYRLNGTLNLVLIGNSTIDVADGPGWISDAITVEKSISISGDGSLTIVDHKTYGGGIYSYNGDIEIAGGEITIDSTDISICAENVMGGGGSIAISGGIIRTNNQVYAGSDFDMSGGCLTVSGLDVGDAAIHYGLSYDLHDAVQTNTASAANKIIANSAGSVIITHMRHTVTFDGNGGNSLVDSMDTTAEGRLLSLPGATKTGCELEGWFTSASGGAQIGPATIFDADTMVYAHWVLPPHTVTFDPARGSCETASAYTGTDGKLTSLPTATRAGYTFDGWYTEPIGGDKIELSRVYTEDTNVFAHWTANPDDPKDGGNNNALLIGGIVGAIAAVAIVAGVVIFLMKRR